MLVEWLCLIIFHTAQRMHCLDWPPNIFHQLIPKWDNRDSLILDMHAMNKDLLSRQYLARNPPQQLVLLQTKQYIRTNAYKEISSFQRKAQLFTHETCKSPLCMTCQTHSRSDSRANHSWKSDMKLATGLVMHIIKHNNETGWFEKTYVWPGNSNNDLCDAITENTL